VSCTKHALISEDCGKQRAEVDQDWQ